MRGGFYSLRDRRPQNAQHFRRSRKKPRERPRRKTCFSAAYMKSRAEGAARDLKGGELIKTVLDAESVPISANRVYHAVVSESRYICE